MWEDSLVYGLFRINHVLKFLLKISTYFKLIKCGFITWFEVSWIPRALDTSIFKCERKFFLKHITELNIKALWIMLLFLSFMNRIFRLSKVHFHTFYKTTGAGFIPFYRWEKRVLTRSIICPLKCNANTAEKGPDPLFPGSDLDQVFCPLSFCLHFCAIVPVLSTVLSTRNKNTCFFRLFLFIHLFPQYKTESRVN